MRWRRLSYTGIVYASPPAPCHKPSARGDFEQKLRSALGSMFSACCKVGPLAGGRA
jgi:hypothetical protein